MKYLQTVLFILAALACIPLKKWCDHRTHGFAVSKILYRKNLKNRFLAASDLPQNFHSHSRLASRQWSLAPNGNFEDPPCQNPDSSSCFGITDFSGTMHASPAENTIEKALSQPYHYLGKGMQCFAFASQDGNYVIKFINQDRHRIPLWVKLFPFSKTYARYATKKMRKKEREFAGYNLAMRDLKEESGLLLLHLESDQKLPTVQLTDPLKITHKIDLTRTHFILQKRAQMVYPTIDALMQQGDSRAARQIIDSVLDLVRLRCEKGIRDRDANVETNLGIIAGKVVQIDLGKLVFNPELKTASGSKKELQKSIAPLYEWLSLYQGKLLEEIEPSFHFLKLPPNP